MKNNEDTTKIEKLNGRRSDDYSLCRLRAEITLKGKCFWKQLKDENSTE